MTTSTSTIRIYVACLASYTNGVLHGAWVDADQDADAIQQEVNVMLSQSKFPNVQATCPQCDGDGREALTGTIENNPCDYCNGSGKVPSAEEWAIHDFEGFEGIKLGEYESFETVAALAELIAEHGKAFAVWYANETRDSMDAEELREAFEEAYAGEFDSMEAYAQDYCDSTGLLDSIPENLRSYFDYEAFGRDLELGGDVWYEQGYVFHNY